MSERSKGDTSSSTAAQTASARVVKNPLLSASVTGLTFDDFQNKPLLLPAAPPIIHPMPVTSSRESTPLVTVGKSSDIDSENLSEVNLNDFSGTPSNTADISDENSNSLVEPSNQIENSILSQAASSFSQLPSVASSVFSTFSKKFNSSSGRDDINFNASPSLNIQPVSVSQAEPHNIQPPPITIGNQERQQDSTTLIQNQPQPPVEPPTFYCPAEVPSAPSAIPCPPAISGQNSYRISARRKIYAPIPGLSSAHQEQNFPTTSGNILAPIGFENLTAPAYAEQTINKPEESKGGLFSLSSFVPGVPNVLQNLSGLVQSAAGSFTQKSQEPPREQPNSSEGIQINAFGQISTAPYQADYLGTQQVLQQQQFEPSAPSEVDFFNTNQPLHQTHAYQPPSAVNFFNPQAVKTTQLSNSPTGPQTSSVEERKTPIGSFFTPISDDPTTGFSIRPPSTESTLIPPLLKSSTPEVQTSLQAFASQELQGQPPAIRPPSGGPPPTSFRLQKGIKSYKSPFVSSSYQEQSFGGHIAGPQASLNQGPTPATSFFPPPLQHSLPPQGIFQPLPLEKDINTATVTENLTRKPDQASALFANSLEPVQIASEADFLLNQPLQVAPETAFEGPVQQPIPLLQENNSSKEQESAAIINSANLHETEKGCKQEALSFGQAIHQDQTIPVQPIGLPPPPLAASEEKTTSTISDSASQHKQDILIVNQSQIQGQTNPIQFNLPPPPPAVLGGASITSKETANFPPPPPQHSFQDQSNSNPYRRGLQSHHSQVPAATSLSSIFTPNNQEINLFKPIPAEPIEKPAQEGSASITSFFATAPEIDIHSNQVELTDVAPPAPEIIKDIQKSVSSEIVLSHTPPIAEVSGHSSIQDNLQLKPDKLEISNAAQIRETQKPDLPAVTQTEVASLPEKTAPVSSFFATSAFVAPSQTKEKNPPPGPPSNFNNFFTSTDKYPPAPSAATQPVENTKETKLEPSKPAAGDKIASPSKQKEIPDSQKSVPNVFTSFFDQPVVTPVVNQLSVLDPTSFFDSFGQVPSVGVDTVPSEDPNSQRIQNFFNNPPPKDPDPVGDLNYNLVGSGLSVKNLQTRSLTPASNLAEPPSSSCSEFSELNSSLSAGIRQPRVRAEDSNKVSPEEELIFEAPDIQEIPEEILNELKMANRGLENNEVGSVAYKPAVKHWFYKRKLDEKSVWTPFSFYDSSLLEKALALQGTGPNLVAVEGGRYDVNISDRIMVPVYWEGEPIEVKRCSWFYKAVDSKYVPYEEEVGDLLEEEYRKSADSGEWHKKIPISAGDMVVFHGPTVIVHFQTQQQVDSWGGSTQTSTRPRVVKRDLDDFIIDEGENPQVDHILFMVHGIGSACDLKMRSVEEVVDEFRAIALQLVQSHYKNSVENGYVGRVEVLPVSWHGELHSEELGIDEKLKSITLESIPKLRNFANDTLLDILFYTSPMFCQRIMNTVTASMNNVYLKYKQRNPQFHGGVSLAGHSLGSLILFDLLCHQRPIKEREEQNMENPDELASGYPVDSNQLNEDAAKHISYKMGPAGTGQPFISYPQLIFQPKKFFALGSPIGMFVTIRGIDKLGLDFRLPTCPGFYNIFHPYDPVAYRLEALVNHDMNGIPPVLIPHHKGRKRMHLELKETMTRVGADLKQRFFETFKTTIDTVSLFAPKSKNESKGIEKEVDKAQQEQQTQTPTSTIRPRADSNSTNQSDSDAIEIDFPLGKLNDSKRIDYVLQEAPLEFFNEYLFALSSHVCYWESEDTILFVMKEIYTGIGISPDSQVPQQTMTIERPSSSGSTTQSPTS